MEWERQRTYDFENGKEAKASEAARSFYANGVSIESISKSLNLSIDRIKEILSEPTGVKSVGFFIYDLYIFL